MRLAIVADSHDNILNIKKTLHWLNKEKIKLLIHCGDLTSKKTFKVLAKNFSGKIFLSFGNADNFEKIFRQKSFNDRCFFYHDFGRMKVGKKFIAFTHLPKIAKKLAKSGEYDLVFYGHTHKPWLKVLKVKVGDKFKIVRLVNPGNLAGLFYKATFALFDTRKDSLELKILESI